MVDQEHRSGYVHVYTPALARRQLYERSGHWAHYSDDDGRLPGWLAPVQLRLLSVGDSDVTVLRDRFVAAGVRVDIAADGTLGRRIRDARRVPWLAVVGPEEAAAQAVALRSRHGSKTLPVAEAVSEVAASVAPPPSVPGPGA